MTSAIYPSELRGHRPRGSLCFLPVACVAFLFLTNVQASAQPPQTQVRFAGPAGMEIRWLHRKADGKEAFSETPLVAPARFNFRQGGLYRLKLSRIPGHP